MITAEDVGVFACCFRKPSIRSRSKSIFLFFVMF